MNKTSLQKLNGDLKTYQQFLPTLDLKRRQLLAEQAKTNKRLFELEEHKKQALEQASAELGILAISHISLRRIITVAKVDITEKNIVGVVLPEPDLVHFKVELYDVYSTPVWLEAAIAATKELITLKVQYQVWQQRSLLINQAVQKTTQRLNLFEKVLIPETSEQIRKIKLFLADEDTAAVVRAKLAKRKLLANTAQAEGLS